MPDTGLYPRLLDATYVHLVQTARKERRSATAVNWSLASGEGKMGKERMARWNQESHQDRKIRP